MNAIIITTVLNLLQLAFCGDQMKYNLVKACLACSRQEIRRYKNLFLILYLIFIMLICEKIVSHSAVKIGTFSIKKVSLLCSL